MWYTWPTHAAWHVMPCHAPGKHSHSLQDSRAEQHSCLMRRIQNQNFRLESRYITLASRNVLLHHRVLVIDDGVVLFRSSPLLAASCSLNMHAYCWISFASNHFAVCSSSPCTVPMSIPVKPSAVRFFSGHRAHTAPSLPACLSVTYVSSSPKILLAS